jgi:hypothetical protein
MTQAAVESDCDCLSSMESDMRTMEKPVMEKPVMEKPVMEKLAIEDDSNSVGDDQPECVICLEHFRDSQLVCKPTNEKCNHLFHKDCMMVWLMLHTRCPICREKYLEK